MLISMFVEQRGIEPRSIRFPMYGFNECRNQSCPVNPNARIGAGIVTSSGMSYP